MNSQGYTKDNIHKGNTKIIAGGIDVDGLIRIGDQSSGGDGYVLPVVKGTEGQVLTMNADNTSSFQDVDGGTSGRIIKNLFTMIDRESSFGATPSDTYLDGFGNLDLGSIDNFPVGATIHLYTKGTWQTSGNGTSNFVFIINDGSPTTITINSQSIAAIANNDSRFFYNDLILQRTDINEYKFKATGLTSNGSSSAPAVSIFWPASTFTPSPSLTNLSLRFAYKTNDNTFYPLTTTLIVDMILDSALLITAPPAPTSHLALTDLNAADSGHPQFALLNGRPTGQVLSGGITNLHNLTLKSHTAGLNNIVVKDLNTTFEKNIDMNQNQIDNVLVINNQAGQPLNLIGGSNVSAVLLDATPTQGVIIGSNVGSSTAISGESQLDLSSNSGSINITPSTFFNVIAGGLPRLGIDATEVNIGNPLNMNNNNITNGDQITCNTINPVGTITTLTSDAIQINTGSPFNRINSDGTLILSGGGLAASDHIVLDGGQVNIVQPLNVFVPSNYFNNSIIGVSSINNLTPVGGLFSGTSDSLNVSATTSEISILPLTFVGVGFGVPPDGFSVGDCFELKLSGPFNSANSDTLTLRLKGGPTATTLLSTLVVPLNASSGSVFQFSVFFQIRAIGVAGVADIISDSDITYNQSGGGGAFVGEQSLSQNNTTFDTTLANILDVTAQFGSTNANNDMTTRVSKLQKTF